MTVDNELVVICLKIRTFVVSATTINSILSEMHLLWFAWKFVPLWYQQQLFVLDDCTSSSCDLLENSYLCGISNNGWLVTSTNLLVVICLKIRTFVVSATTHERITLLIYWLWFAWKFVPLWYQQQHNIGLSISSRVVICLKIRTFVVSATTNTNDTNVVLELWFAWKFVPLWYQQQLSSTSVEFISSCDLLENSYLCGISNNLNTSL